MSTGEQQNNNASSKLVGCLIFGPVLLAIVPLFFVMPLWFVQSVDFALNGTEAEGVVVDIKSDRDDGTVYYYPVIGFYTLDNKQVFFETSSSSTIQSSYEVGEKVAVIYDPTDPEDAKLNTFTGKWLEPIVATLFFGLIVFFGYFLFKVYRERKQQ